MKIVVGISGGSGSIYAVSLLKGPSTIGYRNPSSGDYYGRICDGT